MIPQSQNTEHKSGINPGRYKLCPACGNFNHIDEKQIYCISCGEKLIEECPKCKEPIYYPTARFCYNCGGELRKGIVE